MGWLRNNHMITQVIFKLDKKLKDQAIQKAQQQGIALSSVLKMATKAFVAGDLKVDLVQPEKFNAKTQKIIDKAVKDIKAGKNLSPRFNNVEDFIKYLKSL